MGRILMAAFFRGVGGGLALAATPYLLAFGTMSLTAIGGGVRGIGRLREDAGDAVRYYGELRAHRKQKEWRQDGESWRPEEDGFDVP